MKQFVLDSDQLECYLNNVNNFGIINFNIRSIDEEQTNILIKQTLLPSVLIEIICSYVNDIINVQLTRNIRIAFDIIRYRSVHMHLIFDINFYEYSFKSTVCININCAVPYPTRLFDCIK